TDGTGHLVDRRLTGETDGDEGVIDTPHRAEQTDERSGRADGGEERHAGGQLAVHDVDRALQREGDPLVQVDAVREATVMMGGGADAVFGNVTEVVALLQALDAVLDRRGIPESLLDGLRGTLQLRLIPDLGQDDV